MFFRHYAKNAELAETRVLPQKYSVFWGSSGSKNERNIKNARSKSMLETCSENTPDLHQKWIPKRVPETSEGVPFSVQFCMWFSTCFWRHFWAEHLPKMSPKGGPKCDQKWWKIKSRARVHFSSDLGSILDRFWSVSRPFHATGLHILT